MSVNAVITITISLRRNTFRNGAVKALYWTGNQSALAASNWIFDQVSFALIFFTMEMGIFSRKANIKERRERGGKEKISKEEVVGEKRGRDMQGNCERREKQRNLGNWRRGHLMAE